MSSSGKEENGEDVLKKSTNEDSFSNPKGSNTSQNKNQSYKELEKDKNQSSSDIAINITTYPLKIVFIGNSNVGKTSIIQRFTKETFLEDKTIATICASYENKKIKIDPYTELDMQIWDTAGQERYRSITFSYLRDSNGIFLVFDLSNKQSFDDLNLWIKEVNEADIDDKICIKMLIGNKLDFSDKKINENEAKKFAEENGMRYLSVSAKDGINIITMFEMMGDACAKAIQAEENNNIKDDNSKSDKNTQSKKIELKKKKKNKKSKNDSKCC